MNLVYVWNILKKQSRWWSLPITLHYYHTVLLKIPHVLYACLVHQWAAQICPSLDKRKQVTNHSILIPLSNRTNFNGCTRWSSSVWKVFADELPVNTDELLSKSYPPRPLLVNREFIGVQRWFAGKKSGLKGFPVNTDENADEVLGTARCRNVHVHFLLSCWLADDVIRGWMIFIGVLRHLVRKGGGKIHRCFTSGILPVDSSGVQRVKSVWKGYEKVMFLNWT